MSTEKQIAANRLNALKSTGPRTREGKAKVRLNAKRDGLTGQVLTLAPEDLAIFEKLKTDYIAELNPQTIQEQKLANAIAWDTWRLDHLRAIEINLYAVGLAEAAGGITVDVDNPQIETALAHAQTFERKAAQLALMSLYEQRLNRTIQKNTEALKALQKERAARRASDLHEETDIARTRDFRGLPYEAPTRRSKNGFVFSTAEVLAEANRETVVHDTAIKVILTKNKIQFDGAWENYKPNPVPDRPDSGLKLAAAA